MHKSNSATLLWSARVGSVALVAASLAALSSSPSYAVAATATASPATGAAGAVISLTTATANIFKNAANVSQVGAVQFGTGTCPTATANTPAPAARAAGDMYSFLATTLTLPTGTSNPFTSADVGATVSGTGIASGATITAVNSPTRATLSASSTIEGSSVSISIGGSARGTDFQTHDGKTIYSTAASFASGDAAKVVSGPGIPSGATISSAGSGKATLSVSLTAQSLPTNTAGTTGAAGVAIGTAGGPYAAASFTPVSGQKLVVKAPPAMTTAAAGTAYNICVYSSAVGASGTVIAAGTYKVYPAPTITAISPSSGPALGGGLVSISGTGFSATTKATVDGTLLNNLKVDTTNNIITGNVPSHAPGATDIVVTNEGGPVTLASGYTYIDGITISLPAPATLTSTGTAVLDILGAGFNNSAMPFADFPALTALATAAALADAGDTVTSNAHGLVNGDKVRLANLTGAPGLTNRAYYVVGSATNTFQLATTPGGAAIDFGADGTADVYVISHQGLTQLPAATLTYSATPASNVIASTSHGLNVGDRVMFTGIASNATTTGLSNNVWYYVVTSNANNFQVSSSLGGSPILLGGSGTASATAWTGADTNAHVVVARGAFDSTATPNTPGSIAAECGNVQVLADTELICNIDAAANALTNGAYQAAVVDNLRNGTTANGSDRTTIVTSPSTFTVAPY